MESRGEVSSVNLGTISPCFRNRDETRSADEGFSVSKLGTLLIVREVVP